MADVDIEENDRYCTATATGGETAVPADFPIYDQTEILVERTRAGVKLALTNPTHFTISDVGEEDGFSVDLVAAAQAGDFFEIWGKTRLERVGGYNQSNFQADALNREFDRKTFIEQERRRDTARALLKDLALNKYDAGGARISNVGTPSASSDAVPVSYLDSEFRDGLEALVEEAEGYKDDAAADAAQTAEDRIAVAANALAASNAQTAAEAAQAAAEAARDEAEEVVGNDYQLKSEKGQANGYASLDESGLVPSTQLPSFVDDVIEAANFAALPGTGVTGKIYVTLDNNKTYRWSGSAYVAVNEFTEAMVRATPLTGLDTGSAADVEATDTVLEALGKLQAKAAAGGGLPKNYLTGLTLSNNASDATNDIDIAVGAARADGDAADMVLAAALTKRLDAAWAVGTGNGGLDTGAIADTTYHVFLIKRSDTGVVDVLFSTSATSPTMPANYDYKRRIGSIVRASSAIRRFTQTGDLFLWDAMLRDINVAGAGSAAVTRTLTLPTGVKVEAMIFAPMNGATIPNYAIMSSLDAVDTAPSSTVYNSISGANNQVSSVIFVRTNTSAQIRSRMASGGGSDGLEIFTLGWRDLRGKEG